jgi:enoyl-CoA hydratase
VGRVAVLTMNRERENRFNPELLTEMLNLLDELEANDDVGAIVLTGGDPKFFSNGLDLGWIMANMGKPDAIVGNLAEIGEMFVRWTLFPKPTVAALNGHTFAAGLFLAAHLDFRFMREDRGWVCLPEVDINIPLLPGMIAICQAVMPPQGFRQLYYTGKRFTGTEAMGLGFVDQVFGEDELLPKSIEFAAELAKKRTRTYAEMKRRLRADVAHTIRTVDPEHFMATLSFAMP